MYKNSFVGSPGATETTAPGESVLERYRVEVLL
jgi:hypothetical protein